MTESLMKETDYLNMRRKLEKEISLSAERLRRTVQDELIRMYWNVGRVLRSSGMLTENPSAENARFIARLSEDFKRPDNFFYDAAKFHRLYPKIVAFKLSWSHYSLLMRVDDPRKRRQIEARAVREGLSTKELRVLTRCPETADISGLPLFSQETLACERGRLYHYRAVQPKAYDPEPGWMLVDIGFNVQREARYSGEAAPHSGLIVRSVKEGEDYCVRIAPFESGRLYTYQIALERVIDGDTIVARVNMGFRCWSTQTLRLRGIDAPETTSAAGLKAKQEVKARLEGQTCLIARTYKQEKYGRFLADIFYQPGCDDPHEIAERGIFLNQELLDLGLARVYDGGRK